MIWFVADWIAKIGTGTKKLLDKRCSDGIIKVSLLAIPSGRRILSGGDLVSVILIFEN
jgi:hypothetical protein